MSTTESDLDFKRLSGLDLIKIEYKIATNKCRNTPLLRYQADFDCIV